jgi:acetyltransferase-like isoleucine patch superfamily enzyme
MVAIEKPLAFLKSRLEGKRLGKLMSKLVKFQDAIRDYSKQKRALYYAMGLSFIFYVLAVVNVYVSSRAFGVVVPVESLIVIVPVILVISMIPISLGGVGLQEWAYLFTFSAIGAGGSLGILVALLMRFKGISYGLIGGLLYAIKGTGKETRAELARQEKSTVEADSLRFHSITMDQKQSPLRKYQMLNLGTTSLWQLIKYELLMLFVNDLPGLPGLFLRQKLYPKLFHRMGRGVALGRGLVLRQPSKIEIDDNTVIDDYCMLNVRGSEKSGISIGKNAFIGRNTYLNTREGKIEVHDYANLSSNIRIGTSGTVVIGKYAIIAAFCYIGGVNHRIDKLDVPISMQGSDNKGGVILEEDVWLGAGVLINDGVRIGRGSVIGAGSVVTRDIPPFSIAFGSPAKIVKNRQELAREKTDEKKNMEEKNIKEKSI